MAGGVEFGIQAEGLREVLQSLRVVEAELYEALVAALDKVGEVIRADASAKFVSWGAGRPGIEQAAEGFRVLVRPNTSTMAIVSVGQTLRRSSDMPRRRSNFGALQMTKGLLPARTEKFPEAVGIFDAEVTTLLRTHGF